MYKGSKTKVRSTCRTIKNVFVEIGVHQGSTLSSYLFFDLMDNVMKESMVSWCMIFSNNIILIDESL